MELPSITHNDREIYTLPKARDSNKESVLWFTVPKGGTVLVSKLVGRLAHEAGLTNVFVQGHLFGLGLFGDTAPESTANVFLRRGYCYGFASLPTAFEIPILSMVRSILLVRDPRDMLVSNYYSLRNSHPSPGSASDIVEDGKRENPNQVLARTLELDEYVVRRIGDYAGFLRDFRVMAATPRLYRYEDIVYSKLAWAKDICTHFDWDVPASRLEEIVSEVDIFPNEERPDQHVRQVHPGNYKKKLRPETIDLMNSGLATELSFFGYD